MKKRIILLLVMVLLVFFSACKAETSDDAEAEEGQIEPSAEPSTEAEVEEEGSETEESSAIEKALVMPETQVATSPQRGVEIRYQSYGYRGLATDGLVTDPADVKIILDALSGEKQQRQLFPSMGGAQFILIKQNGRTDEYLISYLEGGEAFLIYSDPKKGGITWDKAEGFIVDEKLLGGFFSKYATEANAVEQEPYFMISVGWTDFYQINTDGAVVDTDVKKDEIMNYIDAKVATSEKIVSPNVRQVPHIILSIEKDTADISYIFAKDSTGKTAIMDRNKTSEGWFIVDDGLRALLVKDYIPGFNFTEKTAYVTAEGRMVVGDQIKGNTDINRCFSAFASMTPSGEVAIGSPIIQVSVAQNNTFATYVFYRTASGKTVVKSPGDPSGTVYSIEEGLDSYLIDKYKLAS